MSVRRVPSLAEAEERIASEARLLAVERHDFDRRLGQQLVERCPWGGLACRAGEKVDLEAGVDRHLHLGAEVDAVDFAGDGADSDIVLD